jgi:DNA-binding LacI/PurR family transcriptional regulator
MEGARVVGARHRITIQTYFDVDGHIDSEGYLALMRDVENYRLAGVAFAFAPYDLLTTPLMERDDPPRINADPMERDDAITRGIDVRHFMYRALNHLLSRGRRRVAVITAPSMVYGFPDEFDAFAQARGIITYPFWTQAVEPHRPRWVRHAVDAILSTQAAERPDSLLITDDHLVEPVAAALREFGVRVPQQMHVIGHWNFPLPYRGDVPIDLLGFDARELVMSWVRAIDALHRHETIPPWASVPARFAWEVPHHEEQTTQSKPPEFR